jgi:hypothetical protein
MTADDLYAKPISIEDLQQFKALTPLPASALNELAKIEALDVTDFYEGEVRTFVIDPIVRILGYDKGTDFSVDLGRPIEFLDSMRQATHMSERSEYLSGPSSNSPTKQEICSYETNRANRNFLRRRISSHHYSPVALWQRARRAHPGLALASCWACNCRGP